MRDARPSPCRFWSGYSPRMLAAGVLAGGALAALQLAPHAGAACSAGPRGLTLVAGLALAALFGRALRNRARAPVLEIRDGVLEWGSIFRARSARRRLPLRDIARLEAWGPNRLDVTTTSGARISIPLHEVPIAQRPVLWRALARGLAAVRGAG